MSGHIHFVTPTNRWIGSIPQSTIDPFTLEPLSTYLRPGPSSGDTQSQNREEDAYKHRRTNLSGQPVSLILARLQTTPQGCSCGCTVPAPPKHSDYYHAQHLLQLVFQTQRVRSRALREHLPQYFEPPLPGEQEQGESILPPNSAAPTQPQIPSAVSVREDQDQGIPSMTVPIESEEQGAQRTDSRPPVTKPKIPRYVHSLIQNRSLKNPLTNTDVEGDPMFFAVLESGCGGWWFEPWAMVIRPAGVVTGIDPRFRYHPQQSQHQDHHLSQSKATNEKAVEKTPEMILEEKEIRKEKWRQARLATLEVEAQHELEWRRWRRSIILAPRPGAASSSLPTRRRRRPISRTAGLAEPAITECWKRSSCPRLMRYKLGKDIAVLEPSERGLRLPKRLKTAKTCGSTAVDKHINCEASLSTEVNTSSPTQSASEIHASEALEEFELEEIRQHRTLSEAETQIPPPLKDKDEKSKSYVLDTNHGLKSSNRRDRNIAARHQELRTIPWWDPEPQPLKMPKTGLSPFAISTLPAPVAKRFGGVSMYQPPELPPSSPSLSQASAADAIEENEKAIEENCDTDGCKWVPVQPGDRVAVMIGSSKDFMLFPSFQRLLFRHLSREDFEDRAGRVGVIPHPASLAFVTQPSGEENRQSTQRETTAQGPLTLDQRGSAQDERREQGASRDEYGQPRTVHSSVEERSRSWLPWRRRAGATTVASIPSEQIDVEGSAGTAPADPNRGCPDATFANEDSTRALDADETTAAKHRESRVQLTQSDEKDHEAQLDLYLQTFEREDYDSSEYSFDSSSDEIEDILDLDINAYYEYSDISDSSEDEDDREDAEREAVAPSRSCSWGRFFFCCLSSSRATQARSRRSRASERRRARRERWHQRHQLRYIQQESPFILRYMPASVQRRISPENVVRCWQMSEFCRFYLTILMAIALMGAIVYGAIHAESMPSRGPLSSAASSPPIRSRPDQSQGKGDAQTIANAVNFDKSSISLMVDHISAEVTPNKHKKDQALLNRRGSCTHHRDVRRSKKGKLRTVSSGI